MNFLDDNMIYIKGNQIEYLKFRKFDQTGLVKHCITTRNSGASTDEFKSLNLKPGIGDEETNVIQNNKIVCKELGLDYENLVYCKQIHGNDIAVITKRPEHLLEVDGLVTNVAGITLITHYADCVPLIFLDPIKKVIGNSHAGWRGTVAKIGQNTVRKMTSEFGSNPKDIIVGIGPSIGKCCFKTDEDVYQEFVKNFVDVQDICLKNDENYYIDLWKANKEQLVEIGVLEENISVSNICTMCNMKRFYSYRGRNGKTGRIGAFVQLI